MASNHGSKVKQMLRCPSKRSVKRLLFHGRHRLADVRKGQQAQNGPTDRSLEPDLMRTSIADLTGQTYFFGE